MITKLIFKPDYTNKGIMYNHIASKIMLPSGIGSLYLYKQNKNTNLTSFINGIFVTTTSLHSYISTSNIITDYVKPKILSNPLRLASLSFHSVAFIGYFYYILNK